MNCGGLIDRAMAGDPAASADLADRFAGPLEFGTAGLRGRMGAGPNRMNTAVVTTATAGLCDFLRRSLDGAPHMIVGYDARHRSDRFARTVAGVATAAGVRVSLLPSPLPTPVLAFALRRLGADAAVGITASHNPSADNGYKVYLGCRLDPVGRGAQLVAPFDKQIYARIREAGRARDVPLAAAGWQMLGPDIVTDYVTSAAALVPPGPRDVRIAELAGAAVTEYDDMRTGWAGLAPTDAVRIVTDRRDKVIARPSGTEPKLKCYLEVIEPVSAAGLPAARAAAAVRLAAIKSDLRRVLGLCAGSRNPM